MTESIKQPIPVIESLKSEIKTLKKENRILKSRYDSAISNWRHAERLHDAAEALRTNAERKKTEMEKNFKLVVDVAMDGIAIIQDDVIKYANSSLSTMFGYRIVDFIQLRPGDLLCHEEHTDTDSKVFYTNDNLAGEKDNSFVYQVTPKIKNNKSFHAEISISEIIYNDQLANMYIVRDISARKQAEEALIKAKERDAHARLQEYYAYQAGVSEMSTTILHNIGNAITGLKYLSTNIMDYAVEIQHIGELANIASGKIDDNNDAINPRQVLKEISHTLTKLSKQHIQSDSSAISDAVNHISEIIRIHQSAARHETLATSANIYNLITDSLRIIEDSVRKCNINITLDICERLIETDTVIPGSQFMQTLINLVKNSIEAIIDNKTLKTQGTISICAVIEDNNIILTVNDNGCGFDNADTTKAFRFGYSTKERGTGYGLHSAAIFTQSIGGSIHIKSDGKDMGANISMIMPLVHL